MTEERFNELKTIGYFSDTETYEKDGHNFTETLEDGEVYVLDKRTYKASLEEHEELTNDCYD